MLMDFARSENHWSTFKNNEQATSLKDYATKFSRDQKDTVNCLDSFLWNTRVNSKVLLHDSILVLFKNDITGIHRDKVVDFSKLITAVTQLIWYISPHHSKFLAHGASLLKVYSHLLQFNDRGRHKHKINKICRETLMELVGSVTTCLEKSFTTRKSFKDVLELTTTTF